MTEQQLLEAIKKNFPKVAWSTHEFIDDGYDHSIIVLDGKLVFRAPKSVEYRKLLKNEMHLLKYLSKRITASIPTYSYATEDASVAGYPFVHGKELKAHVYKKLSQTEKKKAQKQIAQFLTELHSTPQAQIQKFHVETEDQLKTNVRVLRKVKKQLFPRFTKKDIAATEKYFGEMRQVIKKGYSPTLAHNDLGVGHILWDAKEKQINVIDFSDRALTDPAIDFAGLFNYGQKCVKEVLSQYSGAVDENLYARAELYFKRVAYYRMLDALKGLKKDYKKQYTDFKKLFKI